MPGHKKCKGRKPVDCTAPCKLTVKNVCREGTSMTKKRHTRALKNWGKLRTNIKK